MTLSTVLSLLGGIGLFLYGMDLMGKGLKQAAGASLERILARLTSSKLKGLGLGTAVTAIIQSSAATSIMCLGFINAGMMALDQALPVVFGANIGSTITGQILRLGDLGEKNIILTLLKPSSMAPILIAYGVVVIVFIKSRKKRLNSIAAVLLGLGILFFGMSTMESAISPLKDIPAFQQAFFLFKNPFLGILVGLVLTAVIQSSSASVGILQALSSTGAVTWGMAIPIILGQNIGKCFTVLLGSIGASPDSKRLSLCHVLFNVFGVIIFGSLIYLLQSIIGFAAWDSPLNRGNIADFHSLFNIATAFVLLPFSNLMVKLSQKLIKDNEEVDEKHRLDQLDDLLLKTPLVALDAAKKVTIKMGEAVAENFSIVSSFFDGIDNDKIDLLERNEQFLDKAESKISDYLAKIDTSGLTASTSMESAEMIRTVSDFERMGDYCIHIYEMIVFNQENEIEFSKTCLEEIKIINEATTEIISLALKSFSERNIDAARHVKPLAEVIDSMRELVNAKHIERLKEGKCSVQAGISLVEYLNSIERLAGHSSNIAVHAIRSNSQDSYFDTHVYLKKLTASSSIEFQERYAFYDGTYMKPLSELPLYDPEPEITEAENPETELTSLDVTSDEVQAAEEIASDGNETQGAIRDAESIEKKKEKEKEKKKKQKEKEKEKKKHKK